ncbi:hypothetical protein Ciccas_009639 [Cichlidogyrus casuarinus]|uniref:Uncharacterized protein n=1 Tax=Cichlidogyrus casuarinus TaxID=1844966 RepID=A0ABD2PWH1_9PLAT
MHPYVLPIITVCSLNGVLIKPEKTVVDCRIGQFLSCMQLLESAVQFPRSDGHCFQLKFPTELNKADQSTITLFLRVNQESKIPRKTHFHAFDFEENKPALEVIVASPITGVKSDNLARMPAGDLEYTQKTSEEIGFLARKGEKTVAIVEEIVRKDGPIGSVYTVENCIANARQQKIKEECNCLDPTVPKLDADKSFQTMNRSTDCLERNSGKSDLEIMQIDVESLKKICMKPCKAYSLKLKRLMTEKLPEKVFIYGTTTDELTEVHVIPLEENIEVGKENEAAGFWNLLSSLGGVFGLFMGASSVTLVEFITVTQTFCSYPKVLAKKIYEVLSDPKMLFVLPASENEDEKSYNKCIEIEDETEVDTQI